MNETELVKQSQRYLAGNQMQLDYLQELIAKFAMTSSAKNELTEQVHSIAINLNQVQSNLDQLSIQQKGIPILGFAH